MRQTLLLTLCLTMFAMPSLAVTPKTDQCTRMAAMAYRIVVSKGNMSEAEAMEMNREQGLPGMHVDFLDRLVKLIYSVGIKARPDEVAITVYAACQGMR